MLSLIEKTAIVGLQVQAGLPLDNVSIALKDVISHLIYSSLHRCLQRHVISLLPKANRENPKRLKDYEIGHFYGHRLEHNALRWNTLNVQLCSRI